MAGFTEAYAKAGYRLTNPRNGWSAVREDGSAVALTIWQDEIVKGQVPLFMDCRTHPNLADWQDKQGNRIRKTHIHHGLVHCGGQFDIILCRARHPTAQPRQVQSAELWQAMVGIIHPDEFDPASGAFRITFGPR